MVTQYDQDTLDKILNRLTVIDEQSNIFIKIFGKLDPLSSKKRDKKKDFALRNIIENVKDVFLSELDKQAIEYNIDCDKKITCFGWQEDFYIVLTNLVDNSIYWLQSIEDRVKKIDIKAYEDDDLLIIEYKDNGPGIEKHLIESEVIFEPEFSNKTGGGSGLGLAIAGEAIARNEGILKAIYSENGAYFKIEVPIK